MRRSVAADGDEATIPLSVSFAGKLDSMAGACRSNYINLQALLAQAGKRRAGELGRAPATGGWVDDSEEAVFQKRLISLNPRA